MQPQAWYRCSFNIAKLLAGKQFCNNNFKLDCQISKRLLAKNYKLILVYNLSKLPAMYYFTLMARGLAHLF
jgi:hypothetical protein